MTTLADIISEARTYLYSNETPEANRVKNLVAPTDTAIDLGYPPGTATQRGAIISIDLEHIRVWESAGNELTVVERGVDGTTAATHAAGTYVEVMPKFSPFQIMRAINEDLDDLAGEGLFAVPMPSVDITYNPAVQGYDLTGVVATNVIAIQELRYKQPGPSKYWPSIRSFKVGRDMSSSEFASTFALFIMEGAFPGLPIHVRYRSRFTHFANLTDDAQSVAGLPNEANSLPALGAAIALMAGREIKRNFTEATTDPLQLELVLAGNVLNSYKGLMMQRAQRLLAIKKTLIRQYGMPLQVVAA